MTGATLPRWRLILASLLFTLGGAVLAARALLEPQTAIGMIFGQRTSFTPVQEHQLAFDLQQVVAVALFLMAAAVVILVGGSRLVSWFRAGLDSEAAPARPLFHLFVASALSLYFEVVFIRWISAEIRLLAYFKNVTLIACFLGLGLGCLLARRRRWELLFPPALALFILLVALGSGSYLSLLSSAGGTVSQEDLHSWGHLIGPRWWWLAFLLFNGGLALLFCLLVALFIPLGHLVGKAFEGLRPIPAYSANIAGSLAGILGYCALTRLGTSPPVWFGLGVLPLLFSIRDRRRELLVGVALLAAALAAQSFTMFSNTWSAYNKLSVTKSYLWQGEGQVGSVLPTEKGAWVDIGYRMNINDLFFMDITDFSPAFLNDHLRLYPDLPTYGYNLPYESCSPRRVLVVGAGGGNDVAAALRYGAQWVDAVEIDPVIAATGLRLHPEAPYASPRVHLIIDDARHYFQQCGETYDLIVFGILDSDSLLSAYSSVRLDNYVYTLEALQGAARLLAPGGEVAMTVSTSRDWMLDRFDGTFERVFGARPQVFDSRRGIVFIGGRMGDVRPVAAGSLLAGCRLERERRPVLISTDDWPFMYWRTNTIPASTLVALLLMVGCGSVWVWRLLPRSTVAGAAHYFWLGASFLLVEIKAISQLALVWGSTWLVSAIVIGAILALILLANLLAARGVPKGTNVCYGLLLATLLGTYWLDLDWFVGRGPVIGDVLPTFLIVVPLFFAGVIFAHSFRACTEPKAAIGWNIMGGVLGGFLEYASLLYGFRFLALLAAAGYVLSLITRPGRALRTEGG